MNPPRYVCNCAVLRFLPYPDGEEFINVGLVVHCPETGFFASWLEKEHLKRLTDFFPEVDCHWFRIQATRLQASLDATGETLRSMKNGELAKSVFQELVRERESIFRFSPTKTLMTDDPYSLVKKLVARYLRRHPEAQPAKS